MRPGGYIASGIGAGIFGVGVYTTAHSSDGLNAAIARTQAAAGDPVTASTAHPLANLIAVVLVLAAVVLILIGAVGAGVKSGRSD